MVNGVVAAQRVNSIYSNSLRRATSIPIGIARFGGGVTNDNRLLTVAGDSGAGTRTNLCYIGTVSSTDPTQITWVQASSNYPISMGSGASTFLSDGRIVVLGGFTGSYVTTTYIGTLGSIGTNTLTWAAGTAMPGVGRVQHSLNTLSDGRIVLIGGLYVSGSNYVTIADVYIGTVSGNTITWVASNSLPESRANHGACVLSNGKIIVTGGVSGTVPTSTGFTATNHRNTVYVGTVSGNTITWVQSSNLSSYITNNAASTGGRSMIIPLPSSSGNQFLAFYSTRGLYVGSVSSDSTTTTWNNRLKGVLFRNTVSLSGENVLEFSKFPILTFCVAGINSNNRRVYILSGYQDVPAPDYISNPAPPGPDLTLSSLYPDAGRSDTFEYVSAVLVSNKI